MAGKRGRNKRSWPGPEPGVSTTAGEGGSAEKRGTAIGLPPEQQKLRRQPQRIRGEVLTPGTLARGRRVGAGSSVTPGTGRIESDVVEVDMPGRHGSLEIFAEWTSITGESHRVLRRDKTGKTDPNGVLRCLMAAFVEQTLGGDPVQVLDAFGFSMEDSDGKSIWPVPAHVLDAFGSLQDSLSAVEEAFNGGESNAAFGLAEENQ